MQREGWQIIDGDIKHVVVVDDTVYVSVGFAISF